MMLRVFCLNARYCQGQDGPHRWEVRLPRILWAIEEFKPDLVAFQEVLPHQRADIEEKLAGYRWFGLGRQADLGGEQCPVGVSKRMEILGSTNIWLSESPDEPGSIGWDACLPRLCTAVRLRVKGQRVLFPCTHFDHVGSAARTESAALLTSVLDEPRTILAGDFNSRPASAPIKVLKERFMDGFEQTDRARETTTFHDFGRLLQGPQIDYVFYDRSFHLERFEVLKEDGPDYCSDHFPLVAELRMRL